MVPGAPAGLQAFMRQALLLFMRANRWHLAEPTLAIGTALVLELELELSLRGSRMLMVEHAASRWDAFLDQRLMRGVIHAPHDKPLFTGQVVARAREVPATRDALGAHSLFTLAGLPVVALLGTALYAAADPLVAIPLAQSVASAAASNESSHAACDGSADESSKDSPDKSSGDPSTERAEAADGQATAPPPARCVMVATHAAGVIQRAQRVLLLGRGRRVADGRPDRLLSAAAHAPPRKAAPAIEPQGVKA